MFAGIHQDHFWNKKSSNSQTPDSHFLAKLQDASRTPLANDITPHIFRHTYASDLYKAGVDIKQAQYLLGHSDIRITLAHTLILVIRCGN
ncbi:tyrosine-type recombinase/integrase [Lacrimispora sp.]|uniref:tyrosine-type recombinase/integrase n=1 Tax=Lacrimispora sp. TaxID=2719234 RepID=UPI003FA57CDB